MDKSKLKRGSLNPKTGIGLKRSKSKSKGKSKNVKRGKSGFLANPKMEWHPFGR